jgi:amino acid adenylation domain-containing protein
VSTDIKQRISALSDEQRRLLAQRLAKRTREPALSTIQRRPGNLAQFPLSFAQQRLWFLNELTPLNAAFNVIDSTRVTGRFDVSVLEKCLNEVVRRHEVLRTTFNVIDGEPFQRVLPSVDIRVEVEDLQAVPSSEQPALFARLWEQEITRPWSLDTGPVIRGKVWRLAPDDHAVVVIVHHIVSDGWSKNILVRELGALFGAFSRGETSPLPELSIQYGDFTVWQRQWVEGAECAAQLAQWKQQMAGAPVLHLPADRSSHSGNSDAGLHRWLVISSDRMRSLKALGQRDGVTPFMTLLAVFAALLSRYSGQDDIVIGSPVANRNRREVEDLIGCFMNPLPLRVRLDGQITFGQLVGRVRDVALAAYANQDVPFDLLVRSLPSTRESGQAPLFQVLFLLQNFGWQQLALSGSDLVEQKFALTEANASIVPENEVTGHLVYPVALEFFEAGDQLAGCFQYSTEFARIFAHAPEHFERLLDGAIATPEIPVARLPILGPDEERRLLDASMSGGRAAYDLRPVHRLIEAQAARTPDRPAVSSGGATATYREVNARANQLARYLVARGVGPDVPVGIVLNRSIEAVVAILAVLKAGGAYVPLDPSYPSERQGFVLQDAGARLIVTDSRLVDRFLELLLPESRAVAALTTVCLDLEFDQIEKESDADLAGELSIENLAYLIYTSGSTGTPKGTMITHAALANAYFAWRDAYRLEDEATSHLQMASISFDVFSGDLVRALCSGGKLALAPQEHLFSPADLYRLMRDERVDCAEFVPAVVRDLVKYLNETHQTLDFMRLLIVGSDSWFASEYVALTGLCGSSTRVMNSYGVSEATIDSSYFESSALDLPADAALPIGRTFANTGLYVLDAYLQLAPTGVSGELCIGGPGLARGYLNRPDLTAEKFVPHPFSTEPGARLYRTGDLARFLPDGNLELLGRIDNQVKLRGFRIEVGEVEAVLSQHDAVGQSVVVLREDVPGDKRLVAYVVAAPDRVVAAPELRRFVREKLPEYMVPSTIVEIATFPLLPNGKVNRRGLPAPDGQRQTEEAYVAPANEIERSIADVWKELLRLGTVGVHDNFFDLGGHSLLVIQLHSRLTKKLGRTLTVLDLFVHPTIHALASKLGDAEGPAQAEFDVVRDRAAKQRDANRRRRVSSEAREVAR